MSRASDLGEEASQPRWLVEELWAAEAVGIVGGEPKCCKSFLALDLAVAVASGTPCLRRFQVHSPGAVLLYAAEDALAVVRRRLQGISQAAGVAFATLEVHVITAATMRLDRGEDRERLAHTVAAWKPRLLVLDPFVRLHRVDENAAGEVAPLLAFLRELQRRYQMAVVLVHHARKGGAHLRAGQALRGSSELHAWGDSNLYLRRKGKVLRLAVEHRAAPSREDLAVELRDRGGAVALEVLEGEAAASADAKRSSKTERVEGALRSSHRALSLRELRAACRMRMASLCEVLAVLQENGRVFKEDGRYGWSGR